MPIFPTQYSVLAAAALTAHVAEHYALPLTTGRLLLHGVSDTYRLDSPATPYILKVYRAAHRSEAEIRGEVELLRHLQAGGSRVAPPLPDRHGHYLQRFEAAEGPRFGVLFAFAPGQNVFDLSDAQIRATAHEMARLHQRTAGLALTHPRPVYDAARTIEQPLQQLAPVFAAQGYPEGHAWLVATAARTEAQLAALAPASFSTGYCHFDFLPKNFHFDTHDQPTFFDFDFAGTGYLAYDVMTFFAHYFLHTLTRRIPAAEAAQARQLFVAAYREIRPLTDAELAAIPALGFRWWLFFLAYAAEHFEDWSNSFFSPRYVRERVGLIRQWVEVEGGMRE
ncbi:phosphotransferase [Hymenobacter sp. ASUV-10]|uniref:Phosphotransferase n=1 Tax=Hymenobacter aranciens TaxID=3063996 RepID=A0ABT9BG32_9BACT|nr:phosphotransferase [Hymenobacter sp. ASUV-10]MDO7876654.1 phosphotransferase [Hymenobacter sp. ASUV-10]